jgi:16S rRNA (cytosine967-C5)-methyltransferase
VNAVLRTISRNRGSLPLPARPAEPANRTAALDYLSITLSHPRWLCERWYDRFGFADAEAWLAFNNSPAPVTIRINTLRVTRDEFLARAGAAGIVLRPTRFAPEGFVVETGQLIAGANDHWFVVQDEASQLVPLLAGREPRRRVLDTCAAPGGKTTALAATMRNTGLLVACDVRGRRMELLRRTIGASGATNVRIVQADLLMPPPFTRPFDCVLVDAPCSGLGILRRDPDIRWRRREADLLLFAASQLRMLSQAAAAVAPGGRLIYATCSSEPEENEAVADAFLAGAPHFAAVDARRALTDLPDAVIDSRGHLRTLPHVHGLEAFFGAVFQRA